MSVTQLFVELVIVGIGAATWATILLFAFFDFPNIPNTLSDQQVNSLPHLSCLFQF